MKKILFIFMFLISLNTIFADDCEICNDPSEVINYKLIDRWINDDAYDVLIYANGDTAFFFIHCQL